MTNQEMYKCLLRSVNGREIKGIQRIGGLWRLYLENQSTRIALITQGLNVRNANVAIYDSNPFINDNAENTLRLLIRDIPLSVHPSLITEELEKAKFKVVGPVTFQRLRVDGLLTDCLTGNRFVHIQPPSKPVPREMSFGLFKAKIFHFGQDNSSTVTCSRCLSQGHHRSKCSNSIVCRRCKLPGHIQLDCASDSTPTSQSRERAHQAAHPSPANDAPSAAKIQADSSARHVPPTSDRPVPPFNACATPPEPSMPTDQHAPTVRSAPPISSSSEQAYQPVSASPAGPAPPNHAIDQLITTARIASATATQQSSANHGQETQ